MIGHGRPEENTPMTEVGRFTLWIIVAVLVIVVYFASRGSVDLTSPAAR